MMKRVLVLAVSTVSMLLLTSGHSLASTFYQKGSGGIDVSYPNCSALIPKSDYGIVGVNGGTVYSGNPCLSSESKKFNNLSLYVNTGLNNSLVSKFYSDALTSCNGDTNCAAYKYGYNAGSYAISYAKLQGVSSDKWWLDVETENTWSRDTSQNIKSLQGTYDAIIANGAQLVGAYSTTAQWQTITGGWRNNWPSWGATTWSTAQQASKYCLGHEFTGGPSLLMQYQSNKSKLDQDVAC